MSKTIRTHVQATRYQGMTPREAKAERKSEGRLAEALRKQRSGYEKHKNRESWRTEQ